MNMLKVPIPYVVHPFKWQETEGGMGAVCQNAGPCAAVGTRKMNIPCGRCWVSNQKHPSSYRDDPLWLRSVFKLSDVPMPPSWSLLPFCLAVEHTCFLFLSFFISNIQVPLCRKYIGDETATAFTIWLPQPMLQKHITSHPWRKWKMQGRYHSRK